MRWLALVTAFVLFSGCSSVPGPKYSMDVFKGIDDPGMTFDVFSEDGKTVKWWCEIRNDDLVRRFYTCHLTFQTEFKEFGDIEFIGSVEGGKSERFSGQSGAEFDQFKKPIVIRDIDKDDPRKCINGMIGSFPSNKPAIGPKDIKSVYKVVSLAPVADKAVVVERCIFGLVCENSDPANTKKVKWVLIVTNYEKVKMTYVATITLTSDVGEVKKFDVPCTVAAGKTEKFSDTVVFDKTLKETDDKVILKSSVPAK